MAVLLALLLGLAGLTGCGDDDGGGGSQEAFCDTAEELQGLPTVDPDESEEQLDKAIDALGQLEDDAPSDLEDDVTTLREALETFRDEGFDADIDTDELESAGERVDTYLREQCGLEEPEDTSLEE